MEGIKIVLFIQSDFKHVYTLFVELQRGKLEQTSVCLGIVLYCCRTSGHTYKQWNRVPWVVSVQYPPLLTSESPVAVDVLP